MAEKSNHLTRNWRTQVRIRLKIFFLICFRSLFLNIFFFIKNSNPVLLFSNPFTFSLSDDYPGLLILLLLFVLFSDILLFVHFFRSCRERYLCSVHTTPKRCPAYKCIEQKRCCWSSKSKPCKRCQWTRLLSWPDSAHQMSPRLLQRTCY